MIDEKSGPFIPAKLRVKARSSHSGGASPLSFQPLHVLIVTGVFSAQVCTFYLYSSKPSNCLDRREVFITHTQAHTHTLLSLNF